MSAVSAVVEAYVFAATELLNATLHEARFTAEAEDIMHAEFMSVGLRNKTELLKPGVLESLDTLEWLRSTTVRGNGLGNEQAFIEAESAFGRINQSLSRR